MSGLLGDGSFDPLTKHVMQQSKQPTVDLVARGIACIGSISAQPLYFAPSVASKGLTSDVRTVDTTWQWEPVK